MISIENLEKLYIGIGEENDLTTKQLNLYGFNSTDINKLIEGNVIERVKRGHYSFRDTDKLFDYGVKLAKERNYDLSNKIFLKCYELNPNNYKYCFQLFAVYTHEKKI